MSEENQNPQELEQIDLVKLVQENEKVILPLLMGTIEAIQDIPAQLEYLSKIQLASNFIVTDNDGNRDLDIEGFERAYNYFNQDEDEELPEVDNSPEKSEE